MLRKLFEKHEGSVPSVSERELPLLERYYELLREGNERASLVSPKSLETAFGTHFVDSLFLCDFAAPYRENQPVGDIGTGAGFPGIVHAIRFPEVPIRLYERSEKKQGFLSWVLEELQLPNVSIAGDFRGKVRVGLYFGRAVSPRDEYLPMCRRSMAPGCRIVTCLGGKLPMPEVPEGFERLAELRYQLPDDLGERQSELLRVKPR